MIAADDEFSGGRPKEIDCHRTMRLGQRTSVALIAMMGAGFLCALDAHYLPDYLRSYLKTSKVLRIFAT
jgi:hypothetical protein